MGAPPVPSKAGRQWLDKRAWQEVRRAARTLGDAGTLYAVEIHGIKIYFRWAVAYEPPLDTRGGTRATTPKVTHNHSAEKAQDNGTPQPRKPNARQRRSANRLMQVMHQGATAASIV